MKLLSGEIYLLRDNILILSVSRKTLLCRWFLKAARKYDLGVLGSDINIHSPALSILDGVVSLPNLRDSSFIDEVLHCVKKNRIKLIIPTRDEELSFLCNYINEFNSFGCSVLCNLIDITKRMIDKKAFTRFCIEELGFSKLRLIDTLEVVEEKDFPLFFRGVKEYSSLKIKINNQTELNAAFALYPDGIATTFLEGLEISIDCYVSREGKIIYIVPRSRDIVLGNESIVTTTIDSPFCYEVTKKLLSRGGIRGPVVLQGMINENNFVPFEINLRFGGASVLAFNAAYSGPELVLKEYIIGEKLTNSFKYKHHLKLFKDFQEVYINN